MDAQSISSCEVALSHSTVAPLTPSKKRNYQGLLLHQVPFESCLLSGASPSSPAPRESSPASPLSDLGPTPGTSPQKDETMAPDSKKRKLTFAEREVEKTVKKQEKEQREKEKLEAKAAKDDEKRRREEEKDAARRAKEAVREEKKKAKDAVQQEKEAEKKRKEAEVLKKQQVCRQTPSPSILMLTCSSHK